MSDLSTVNGQCYIHGRKVIQRTEKVMNMYVFYTLDDIVEVKGLRSVAAKGRVYFLDSDTRMILFYVDMEAQGSTKFLSVSACVKSHMDKTPKM